MAPGRNDVGLLAEQYDSSDHRLLGDLPQAFSHTAIINTAVTRSDSGSPTRRGRRDPERQRRGTLPW